MSVEILNKYLNNAQEKSLKNYKLAIGSNRSEV